MKGYYFAYLRFTCNQLNCKRNISLRQMDSHRNYTDPTYLRSIRDGLQMGSLHIENSLALPFGLSGIYENAMPASDHPEERQSFLDFFGVWACLRKEVSTEFVASILVGWTEAKVLDEINRNSKWFNVAEGGRYTLYHERLQIFILQKISAKQLNNINEAIISICYQSLREKQGNEWEIYALDHLSSHLLLPAMESGKSVDLKKLAYDTSHWSRQIEISKDFEWSKRMLVDMMLWASKYDDEEVIECALNQVDLYHLEQNDAPRIVELVKQNDIATALQRIEAFGGHDKEGLQRKFFLYMLCLMELTLPDQPGTTPDRLKAGNLIEHFDKKFGGDSPFAWDEIPINIRELIVLMAQNWFYSGIDFMPVFRCFNRKQANFFGVESAELKSSIVWAQFLLENEVFGILEPSKRFLLNHGLTEDDQAMQWTGDFLEKRPAAGYPEERSISLPVTSLTKRNSILIAKNELINFFDIPSGLLSVSEREWVIALIAVALAGIGKAEEAKKMLLLLNEKGYLWCSFEVSKRLNNPLKPASEKFTNINSDSQSSVEEKKPSLAELETRFQDFRNKLGKHNAESLLIEAAMAGYLELAEEIAGSIPELENRHDAWWIFGKDFFMEKYDIQKAILFAKRLKTELAVRGFLTGCFYKDAQKFFDQNYPVETFKELIFVIQDQPGLLLYFLQFYGVRKLFFENPDEQIIKRLNQSLRLSWAIDIRNSFPAK